MLAGAPAITDALSGEARAHFEAVQRQLTLLDIPFRVNPRMVRGLDYYTRTAFEFLSDDPVLGTASAVGGGGRYDRLVKELGGPDTPAVGWALGMDRLCLLLQAKGAVQPGAARALRRGGGGGRGGRGAGAGRAGCAGPGTGWTSTPAAAA